MNVALVKNNKVDNIIVVDTIEWAYENLPQYDEIFDIDITPVAIGSEKKDGSWQTPPQQEPSIIYKNILTPLEFLNRFTNDEVKTIMVLSKKDLDVELWWLKYNKAQDMDLDDPQTIEGVNLLEIAGIIQPGRATEILTKYPI